MQRVDGYEATLVAGTPIFEHGAHTGALPGKLVRAGQDTRRAGGGGVTTVLGAPALDPSPRPLQCPACMSPRPDLGPRPHLGYTQSLIDRAAERRLDAAGSPRA